MMLLRSLAQLSALLIHGGWWGVAPSPTEEGALRGGHGDHGEPGHQEPHKDSYSTFASEFLESRYLSDDGQYPLHWGVSGVVVACNLLEAAV